MEARRVPKFGACGNCLFDERSVIVFLHFLALILGMVSAMMSSGEGLTMSFFEPNVPQALKSISGCPTKPVGRAPFLFLTLSDYIDGEGGQCIIESLPKLQAKFNVTESGESNAATGAITVMAVLNVLGSLGLFAIAIGDWRGDIFIDASNSGGLMLACLVPALFSFTGALITSSGWKSTCLALPDSSCFAPSCWEEQIYCCDLESKCTSTEERFNSTTLMDAYQTARTVEGLFWGAAVASLLIVFLYASMARSGRTWTAGHKRIGEEREMTKIEAW